MKTRFLKPLMLAVLGLLLTSPLFAQYYGSDYSIHAKATGDLNFSVKAKNCNLAFSLENAIGYCSFYETENDGIWYLSSDGWIPADSKQTAFVKKQEAACSPYIFFDNYQEQVESSPVGTIVYVSGQTKKDNSLSYMDTSYIPLSSQLSSIGKLVNAARGTFYVSCLLENNKCITFSMKPDFYLYNNEYYLLDPEEDTIANQALILNQVFGLQSHRLSENDVLPEMVQFATPQVLPQFIAESIWNNETETIEGYPMYESFDVIGSDNGYITLYLDMFLINELPILYSDVYMWFGFDYSEYELQLIDDQKGAAIANKALELKSSATDFLSLLDKALKSQDITKATLVIQPEKVHLFDLESFGVIVPEYEDVMPGNILVNTRNAENPFALVTGTNQDPMSRSDIFILYYDEKTHQIKNGTWADLEKPEQYMCRHLLDTSVLDTPQRF